MNVIYNFFIFKGFKETAKDDVFTLDCDAARVLDKPFVGGELPHSVKSKVIKNSMFYLHIQLRTV